MRNSQIYFLKAAEQQICFRGKTILEIGCGNGEMLKEIAKKYNPEMLIGIDPKVEEYQEGDNWKIVQDNTSHLNYSDCFFDAVISIATFEHISDIERAFLEIKRVLKPFGKFYFTFGPIWTSIVGHHFFLHDRDWAGLIPPWGHLWMNKEEMFNYLHPLVGDKMAKEACVSIYDCNRINRLTRRDYYNMILNSGLWVRFIKEHISLSRFNRFGMRESEYSSGINLKFKRDYLPQDLSVLGMTVLLEKYANL